MLIAGRCYDCFRPVEACFCAAIPRIDNETDVLILQHRREHFHPFNTARIVHKALRRSRLLSDHNANLAERLELKPGAVLLYPGPTSHAISALEWEERPEQLVVVDGTWHHAKTLVRDIPALGKLPRYRLAPSAPGRYRIRREPDAISLSTVEAVVEALRILEPQTTGFEQLLAAFDTMVERQLAHLGSVQSSHFTGRVRPWNRIPRVLHGDLRHVVVAYGESAEGQRGVKRNAEPPVVWVAQRLGDGASFQATLRPPQELSDAFLGHLQLERGDFQGAVSLDEARRRWMQFLKPGDLVMVMNPGTAKLHTQLAGARAHAFILKSIDLDDILDDSDRAQIAGAMQDTPSVEGGRAARRLAEAIALVRQLNALTKTRG